MKYPVKKHLLIVPLLICIILAACGRSESTQETSPAITEVPPDIVPTPITESVIAPTITSIETPGSGSPIDEIISNLEDLPIDQFFDESFKQLLLRSPETLTYAHLSEQFGVRDDQLNDLSDAYIRQTQQLEVDILDILRTYDREQLTPEQQLSYDIYEWDLDDRVRGHQFMYNDYPVNHIIFSYDFALNGLFTEIHQLNNKEDVEDYISRLS